MTIINSSVVDYDEYGNDLKTFAAGSSQAEYDLLKELNPCAVSRPLRNGDWIKKYIADIKCVYSVALAKFTKSGLQDGEDVRSKFYDYCDSNLVTYYVGIMVNFDKSIGELVCRNLPNGFGSDTLYDAENTQN